MRFADLHLHTYHSDGMRSPRDIVELAASHQLDIIAISDHDNLAAFHEAAPLAHERSILLIPAVELSAAYRGVDVHILAYSFDPEDAKIAERLEHFRQARETRGIRMVENLQQLGYPITTEQVQALSGDGALGRPHVARALIESGVVESIDDAFRTLLKPGKPGFVPKARLDVDDAVEMIHAAGGLLSVAHPTLYPDHQTIVPELFERGVDGVEAHHPKVDLDAQRFYIELAKYHGKIVTGGSDDHGFDGREAIGSVRVPEDEIQMIVERVEQRA